ncbi:VWA domain-containing protein [Paenibacillus ginsengarvi]|uniref:VWA domain-containing protein n=1 Tax=Paenibacillus ginsengarvi TaxID=400777 RepID=A0A3B0CWV5_9BACL|nr:VWA domain-containing protein [Paenibacillus ginsengarvi]RKN86929.1 VWA domain-containing protein [Paenibacillus ginsengarvi]
MGLQVKYVWLLLLLVPAAGYTYWVWRSAAHLSGWRRRFVVGLRSALLLLLVLSLAGLQSYTVVERKAVVFVADRSDSMTDASVIAEWIRQTAPAKAERDAAGVISAGLDAAIEKNTDMANVDNFIFGTKVNTEFTRLDEALRLAETMMPGDASPRIVLLSDGRENVGDLLRQAKLLRDKGIPIDVVPLSSKERKDASVDSLRIPEKLYQAEQYALEVNVTSTFKGAAELRLYEDNREIASRSIELERGPNRFVLPGLAKEQGLHRYRAELYADGDEVSANNAGYSFSRVSGPPKVLLVEGNDGAAQNLAAVLESGLIPYDRVLPELMPKEFADYTAYDSIVLANVAATRMSGAQMEMVEQAVRDYGIGLVMTGGEDSFGLGGYFKTPIERALPVYMDLRGKREVPSLALMLVIDKSGSMNGEKMQLAQEAAARTVELMREKDTIGVLAFDSSPWWVVEPQQLKDPKKVTEQIMSIAADGGTDIYPAVEQAYEKLRKVDAQRKHIILLTDGQSATNQSYEALAAEMVKNNMTLSSVAIGDGADTQLLERIAQLAKGRYYFTNDQSTVPAIFSREAVLVSRTYIVDQPFVPSVGQAAEWDSMFLGGLPRINAYIATTPKETAEVALASPEPDPLLARWQYGAGKTVAWTSDLTGQWSGDWVKWSKFQDVFSRIVKWTFPQFQASPLELTSRLNGNTVVLEVRGGGDNGETKYEGDWVATITDEELNRTEVPLEPTVPGEFVGELPITKPGVYLTQIAASSPETPDGKGIGITTGFVVPYSPEYRIGGTDDGLDKLSRLAELTGGRVLDVARPEDAFAGAAAPKKQVRDLSRALLIAALALWLADIAARRLHVPWRRLALALSPRGARRPLADGSGSATLERLRSRVAPAAAASPPPARPAPAAAPTPHSPTAAAAPASPPASPAASPPASPPSAAQSADGEADRLGRLLAAKKRRER